MAAPCFYTAESLASDLACLGFEKAYEPEATSPTGELRLTTLAWLANVIDPTFDSDTEESVADFWDALGLHSIARKAGGHRYPVIVTGDKQRERNAASHYMRTAIDLTMAYRRRRAANTALEPENMLQDDEEEKHVPVLTEEDIAANAQLDQLIKNRHTLFPSTVRLLEQPQVKKRRPLAQRKGTQNNGPSSAIASQFKSKSPKKGQAEPQDTTKTREEILERLRSIQRDAQDLRAGAENSDTSGSSQSDEQNEVDLDDGVLKDFGSNCEHLAHALKQFNEVSSSALAIRARQTNLARRDLSEEKELSAIAIQSAEVGKQVSEALAAIKRVQEAVSKLESGRRLLESLPNSYAMREVLAQKRRLEGQMI